MDRFRRETADLIRIGMTRRQAYDALGLPEALDHSFVEGCARQQWVFRERGLRLYFAGDRLTAWHTATQRRLETVFAAAG